ncbi:SDR family oxidoreductase [Candidatus Roizmanbacteria bacterium CG06_land_8_20_14_3_00_34_14]|uniref:SDR family oxidoreductase n=3 Tax=Candidatus Roizmaniibacteriota TaxID=1752723 RepID=A0A2M7ATD1_9BACT|nr:MAG: SDR family oxidoreductase [Candidatus Roizmanbacteria bacterium CG07_land_8_20_14_0_80_34_15]PIU73874.1 MAG: SDR family oxidoreductase [Candidatus Roizmanbacteria bacterium CG06_land_8_20_14_3_00_34_14]
MEIIQKDKLLNLSGKTAIVTGGSLGIGYGISYRLAEAGANVVITSRNLEEVNKAVEELKQKGFKAVGVKADVSIEEDIKNLVTETIKSFGSVDILVNNAGMFPFAPLSQLTSELFDKVIATNLRGVFLATKYVSEQMIKQGKGGKIINITSIDSLHPSSIGLAHYDASKHGVWGFTKNVALELAKNNIWVNAVAPGGVMTHGVAVMQSQGKPVTVERNPDPPKMEVAMGRMGVPDDIGKVVLFLASEMSSYMTGSQIVVDGGYLLK